MRIKVHGDGMSSKVLRSYLEKDGFAVTDKEGDYDIYFDQDNSINDVVVDGIDCDLERRMISNMETLGVGRFILARKGGVRSDRAVRVAFPDKYAQEVELGTYRAIAQELGRKKEEKPSIGKMLIIPIIFILLALAANVRSEENLPRGFVRVHPILFQPTNFPIVRFWDGANVINAGDNANNALRVNLVASTSLTVSGTITANQGTAASSTAGWPVINGTVATATAAWTSATGNDTVLSASTTGYSCVLIDYRQNGAITSGTINYEMSVDGGTNWKTLLVNISTVAAASVQLTGTSYGLTTGSAYAERHIPGVTNVRVRLNPVIVGAGTANIAILPTAAPCVSNLNVNSSGRASIQLDSWFGASTPTVGQKIATGSIPVVPASDVNGPVNVAQIAGTNTVTAAAGVQKVGVIGNANAAFDAADNAAPPANEIAVGLLAVGIGVQPTNKTGGNLVRQLASTEGVTYVQIGNSTTFSCFKEAITVLTECKAAPGAGLKAYIGSATISNEAATVQGVDIVFGTGTNCATAPTAITHKVQFGTNATTTSPQSYTMTFSPPLVPTAANAICCRPTAATAFGCTLTGFVAP